MKIQLFILTCSLLGSLNLFAQNFYTPSSSVFGASNKNLGFNVYTEGESNWVITKELILISSEISECMAGCPVRIATKGLGIGSFALALNGKALIYIEPTDPDDYLPPEPFKLTYETNWFGNKKFTVYLNLDELQKPKYHTKYKTIVKFYSK